MMIMSIMRKIAMTADVTLMAFAGEAKNRTATMRFPIVRQVYEKSKKPDPRECIPGGDTNRETRSSTHQRKEMTRKRTVM